MNANVSRRLDRALRLRDPTIHDVPWYVGPQKQQTETAGLRTLHVSDMF